MSEARAACDFFFTQFHFSDLLTSTFASIMFQQSAEADLASSLFRLSTQFYRSTRTDYYLGPPQPCEE